MIHLLHNKRKWTTREAASIVGISRITLQRWIASRKFEAPKATLMGARGVRFWSVADIAMLRAVKQRIYRKGRGRKKNATRRAARR